MAKQAPPRRGLSKVAVIKKVEKGKQIGQFRFTLYKKTIGNRYEIIGGSGRETYTQRHNAVKTLKKNHEKFTVVDAEYVKLPKKEKQPVAVKAKKTVKKTAKKAVAKTEKKTTKKTVAKVVKPKPAVKKKQTVTKKAAEPVAPVVKVKPKPKKLPVASFDDEPEVDIDLPPVPDDLDIPDEDEFN